MSRVLSVYRSSLGKKYLMAITGLIGFLFVVGHLIGNLQAFLGPEVLNAYAAALRKVMGLLWAARIVLLAAVVVHIVAAYQLSRMSWEARPVGYASYDPVEAGYASRTMRWSGPILALFILYHLMHFTWGNAHPNFEHGNVYANLVSGFQVWYVSAFYIVAMLALGLHLYHGVWSAFQSLGLNNAKYDPLLKRFSAVVSILIVLGNISLPLAVLAGIIR